MAQYMKGNALMALTIILALATALTSCSEEYIMDNNVHELSPLSFNAAPPTTTRTALDSDGNAVVWEATDEIAVYDFNTTKHKFVIAQFDKSNAQFTGKITAKKEQFLAVYPYSLSAENLTATGEISVELPSQQNAALSSFASNLNISIGKGARNVDGSPSNVTFYNVCQLLKFHIPEYASGKIKQIQFNANTAVAGTLNVAYTANTPVTTVDQNGSKVITILPPTGSDTFAAGTYYIVSAPVVLNGFSMAFTCDGSSYTLASNSTFGGEAGKIYTLGVIDLVNTPQISTKHVYSENVLQGTEVTLSNAPIDGSEWNAIIRNSSGNIVRNVQGIGTLTSTCEDLDWPYLLQGDYTVEYNYTTSNGKDVRRTIPFTIRETPRFSISTTAYTSYSYYKGNDTIKDINKANALNNVTIYEPQIVINNISEKILNNSKYTFTVTNDFNGILANNSNGLFLYKNYTVTQYGAYTLTGKVVFDGVEHASSKTVYITGIPYTAAPPTKTDWTGSANKWDSDFVRLHKHTITKTFYCPENINVSVAHNVYVRNSTIGSTYKLLCSGVGLKSIAPSNMNAINDVASYPAEMTTGNPTVECYNSYGTIDFIQEQTHAKIFSVSVMYR